MEDAPPPYGEVVSGKHDSGGAPPPPGRPGTPPTLARLMPLDFNVYCGPAGPLSRSDLYFMGPHRIDRQFALTIHQNSFAQIPRPFLILHDGLTAQDPAIGIVTNAWNGRDKFCDKFIIDAPPRADSGLPPVQESLKAAYTGTFWHPIVNLRYSVRVAPTAAGGSGGGDERQEFEWQESTSGEVSSLGGDSRGWRLVALADESETLAVCARNGGGLTRYLRFSFMGKGRAADHFGPTWEIMAVLTGLTTWNRLLELQD
ncbi:hypothetical protein ANO14919_109510 [Xylariales sp. No.14919]|nr:hypothetical protein ANO14919_109510 [Xylariales sp. No.14919]